MNAANATWDLVLDKPYSDGGYENSSRVLGPAGFDLLHRDPAMRCGAHVDGSLNDPSAPNRGWTVEVALPLAGLAVNKSVDLPPRDGQVGSSA